MSRAGTKNQPGYHRPHTWIREVIAGDQPEQDGVGLVPVDDCTGTPGGKRPSKRGRKRAVYAHIHEDSLALCQMAVFGILVHHAGRKGSHVLVIADRHRYGVNHGLTFHSDHKLRTVLWGWTGEALNAEELEGIDRVLAGHEGELGQQLAKLLIAREIEALAARCTRLRSTARLPSPTGGMPAVPWRLF